MHQNTLQLFEEGVKCPPMPMPTGAHVIIIIVTFQRPPAQRL